MKKEQVTQFDLESAFKALDEIEIPKVKGGIKPNRMNLHEATKRVDRLSMLVEDYYNLREEADLQDAANDREDEIAKAKLARIEKIVDLNAESEDDILPSYVGKIIIQCPQCMTLFYKKPEDVIPSDEDPDTVNVGEECQHCGNNDGYTLIGKVAAEESTDLGNENTEDTEMSDEGTGEEFPDDLSGDEDRGETADEGGEEDLNVNLDDMTSSDVAEEEGTEDTELKEAAFNEFLKTHGMLNEDVDVELNKKLAEHNTYISYLQDEIKKADDELKKAKNEEIKTTIQNKIDILKQKLEEALPDAVKDAAVNTEELPEPDELPDEAVEETTEEIEEEPAEEETIKSPEDKKADKGDSELLKESEDESVVNSKKNDDTELVKEYIKTSLKRLQHDRYAEEISDFEFIDTLGSDVKIDFDKKQVKLGKMLTANVDDTNKLDDVVTKIIEQFNKNTTKNITEAKDATVKDMWNNFMDDDVSPEEMSKAIQDEINSNPDMLEESYVEIDEKLFNTHVSNYLRSVYENVDRFETTECNMPDNHRLIVEGNIVFNSGRERHTRFEFAKKSKHLMEGVNKDFSNEIAFNLRFFGEAGNSILMTESLEYNYEINRTKISGKTKFN